MLLSGKCLIDAMAVKGSGIESTGNARVVNRRENAKQGNATKRRLCVKALLCIVLYRLVMALLGIEMALTRSGEAGISGVRALNSDEWPRQ